jgi:Ca2+:H+ antiporter
MAGGAPGVHASARRLSFSREDRIAGLSLAFVVGTLVAAGVSAPATLQFFLAVLAIVPLAAFIGSATEALADQLGGKVGGLLNATFGNAPDLLVGVFGVQRGLIPLVKATLIGALISNSALIMGLCYVVAGLRFRRPRFKADEAGHHSVLMLLTLAALLFPSVGALVMCRNGRCAAGSPHEATILHISVGIAVVLLLAYAAYVAFAILGFESLKRVQLGQRQSEVAPVAGLASIPRWPVWFSAGVLCVSTAALIPVTDILTGSVDQVTHVLGWTEVFVGIIVVANSGNVAEAYSAIRLAFQRGGLDPAIESSGLDLSLSIASASSIQIATFVAPLVVLYSLTSHTMNLVFSPIELSILTLLVLIFAYIAHDGESNWLEGAELIALYLMAAIVFFALPASAFGG